MHLIRNTTAVANVTGTSITSAYVCTSVRSKMRLRVCVLEKMPEICAESIIHCHSNYYFVVVNSS